ncbi:MAG: MarR family transcriptional regulator [Conexibacteraceae bacterium]|nr:MarR family transcriptional regulator [Conexibacteraceae bacterium]
MNAVELYLLGRKLMKIAEEALPKPPTGGPPTRARMVLIDIAEHPDSSVGEIASRTGFPQSHVSASVARLRELGALETSIDSRDRRRTLTRLAPGIRQRSQRAEVPVESMLAAALGPADPVEVEAVIEALDGLAARLMPASDRRHTQAAGARR